MRRLGLLYLAVAVLADARHDAPGCGATRASTTEALFLHRQSTSARHLRRAALAAAIPGDRDIGNVAIIDDSNGVVEKLNQFNLDRATLAFTPSGSTYRYALSGPSYDPDAAAQGSPLIALGDDDAREISLPFAFSFYGTSYTKLWVNSDGNLTFNAPEYASSSRSTGRMISGPPRIAPLFDDLDPSRTAGGVRVFADATHAVISWIAVPEWEQFGIGPGQTFQVRLFADGRIVFAYAGVKPGSAVVGLAPGSANPSFTMVSFRNDPPADNAAGVVERFGDTLEIDTVLVAQRFYQTHDDAYDYLAIYNNSGIPAMSGAIAYESTIRSSGSGWGVPPIDAGRQYGSPSRLRSLMNMGYLTQYPKDPNATVPARSAAQDTPLTVLGHEAGHLFLALASIADPNDPNGRPMLGYGGVHWSFVFNSEASLDEGEQITDRGTSAAPRFLTSAVTQGYAPLDQYLMGFRPAADVPDTFVVTDYSSNVLPILHPSKGQAFDGNRLNITMDDLVKAEGRRTPDSTVAQRRYRFGFILIVPAGSQVPATDVQQVETYRQQFEPFFAKASSGNAVADTALSRGLKLSLFPAAGVIAGATATATLTVQTAPRSDLTVQLQTPKGFAQAPASVRIPAGSTSASFPISGVSGGVEELLAAPADSAYETAFARVQVTGQPKLTVVSGAPDSIIVRLTDVNDLPYPGARITAAPSSGGSVAPAVAVTDAQGHASFRWNPGSAPSNQLKLAAEAAPAISLTLSAGSAVPRIDAVVNAASLARGIVPGAIETVFGANLAGGKVTINGTAAPIFYASDKQIDFYVPANTPLGTATVAVNGAALEISVSAAQPGIFAAVVDRGYLVIYCTGLGGSRPTVYFGATPAQPVYSGAAPGYLGLNQVNVKIPDGVAGAVQVVLASGTAVSNAIAVTVP